jgi:membrane fusion protein (multidrug efflux system)
MNGKNWRCGQRLSIARLAAFVAIFAAGAPAFAQQSGQQAPPPAVSVITATPQPVYSQQSYVGRIQAPLIVQLQARVTGYLESQAFQDGDTVTQGQLLYVIEQPPYQAAVDQAQAGLEQAEAAAHNSALTLARSVALLRTPAGQQSNVDASRATADSDAAGVASAKAQLETAEINMGYTEIRSPINGQIGATAVNVGNVVGPTSGVLATVVSQDPMYVNFSLPVLDALKLRDGDAEKGGLDAVDVLIQLPDGQIYPNTGRINFVNNQITPATDTLNMRATIPNPPLPKAADNLPVQHELQDGEFVNVILRGRVPQQQIRVPLAAIITDQLGSYVLVVDSHNIVHRQVVTLGQATAQTVAIASGLKGGELVMVDGIQRVHPGIAVNPQIVNSTSASSSPASNPTQG